MFFTPMEIVNISWNLPELQNDWYFDKKERPCEWYEPNYDDLKMTKRMVVEKINSSGTGSCCWAQSRGVSFLLCQRWCCIVVNLFLDTWGGIENLLFDIYWALLAILWGIIAFDGMALMKKLMRDGVHHTAIATFYNSSLHLKLLTMRMIRWKRGHHSSIIQ